MMKIYFDQIRIEDSVAISRERVAEVWKASIHPRIVSRLFALFTPQVPEFCLTTPFCAFLGSLYRGSDSDRLDILFRILDYDGDGYISAGDVARYFRLLFESASKSHGIGADADIPFEVDRVSQNESSISDSVDLTDDDVTNSDSEKKDLDVTSDRFSLYEEMESILEFLFPPLPLLPPMDTKGCHPFALKQKFHRAFAFAKQPAVINVHSTEPQHIDGHPSSPHHEEEDTHSHSHSHSHTHSSDSQDDGVEEEKRYGKGMVGALTRRLKHAPEILRARVGGEERREGEGKVCKGTLGYWDRGLTLSLLLCSDFGVVHRQKHFIHTACGRQGRLVRW